LGKQLEGAPLLISSMTGGWDKLTSASRVAQRYKIAMGSWFAAVEKARLRQRCYAVAPRVFVCQRVLSARITTTG